MSDNDFDWSAFEAAGESHGHGMDAESEGKVLLLQSKAVSALAALAGGQTSMVMAQLDELWALSCMEKVFCMATWVRVAGSAAQATGAELALAFGDAEGKVKADLSEPETVSESFMNLLLSADVESVEPAFDAMHDYLHQASETQGREVFINILGATAEATKACMAKANGIETSGLFES